MNDISAAVRNQFSASFRQDQPCNERAKLGMKHTLFTPLMLVCLTGCATSGLPYPRWAEVGRQWGCEPLAVQQAMVESFEGRPRGYEYIPEVGWEACELLAKAGEPQDVTRVQTDAGLSYSLYYRRLNSRDVHFVRLDPNGDQWRVAAVAW